MGKSSPGDIGGETFKQTGPLLEGAHKQTKPRTVD